ncbi:MAG: glycosyltransferase family 2 protein [Campylobacterota bacterium]|nr:glycosyltransferase family 2 protein [Campylobacterota bacterium]
MKISVCIATYNGEKYIKEQLDSILVQLDKYDEIIVSDDSSTDSTIEIIKLYNDIRIKIYENQKFKSPIFNFENALKHSNNEYIFLADQDDIWMPNKVEEIKNCLKEYDLIVSDANIINSIGDVLSNSFYQINNSKQGFIHNIIKNSYLGCCMAFNRSILEIALPFPKDIPMHDWWIGLIGELYGKTYFIEDRLIVYRKHDNNVTSSGEKSSNSFYQKIIFRILMIKNILLRSTRRKR